MIKLKNIPLFIVFVIGCSFGLSAQQEEAKNILSKVLDYYKSKDRLIVEMSYHLIKDGEKEPENSYGAKFLKDQTRSKFVLLNSEVFTYKGKQVVIDHDSKAISYAENSQYGDLSFLDVNKYLEYYKIDKVVKGNGEMVCHLLLNTPMVQVPYKKIILYVDDKNYTVKKQELFFSQNLPFTNSDGKTTYAPARLLILMNHNENPQHINIESFDSLISKDKQGNYKPIGKYKDYQLVLQN